MNSCLLNPLIRTWTSNVRISDHLHEILIDITRILARWIHRFQSELLLSEHHLSALNFSRHYASSCSVESTCSNVNFYHLFALNLSRYYVDFCSNFNLNFHRVNTVCLHSILVNITSALVCRIHLFEREFSLYGRKIASNGDDQWTSSTRTPIIGMHYLSPHKMAFYYVLKLYG